MTNAIKPKILLLDTDNDTCDATACTLQPNFTVITVRRLSDLPAALHAHVDAKLFILATAKGADSLATLASVRRARPKMLRFLLTAFDDLSLIVEGLHDGSVQRVLSKPLKFVDLLAALPRADAPNASIFGVPHT